MPSVGVFGTRDPVQREVLLRWDKLTHRMVRKNFWRLNKWFDYADLMNHAREAIWRAHLSFDPSKANFQTFARAVMTNEFNKLHHYAVADMRRDLANNVSLDLARPDGTPVFHFPSPDSDRPDAAALLEADMAIIHAAISDLPGPERRIILDRVVHDKSLEEIGKAMDLTRERIRQLERIALRRLQFALEGKFLERGRRAVSGPLSLSGLCGPKAR